MVLDFTQNAVLKYIYYYNMSTITNSLQTSFSLLLCLLLLLLLSTVGEIIIGGGDTTEQQQSILSNGYAWASFGPTSVYKNLMIQSPQQQ